MPKSRPPISVIAAFRRTANLMVSDLVRRLAAAGFPDVLPTFHPVFENLDPGGTRVSLLAARADLTHQSMSELVVILEQRGWIERRPDPADGRARLVCLTPDGKRLVRASLAAMAAIEAEWQERWRQAGGRIDIRNIVEAALPRAEANGERQTGARVRAT